MADPLYRDPVPKRLVAIACPGLVLILPAAVVLVPVSTDHFAGTHFILGRGPAPS